MAKLNIIYYNNILFTFSAIGTIPPWVTFTRIRAEAVFTGTMCEVTRPCQAVINGWKDNII